MKSAISGCPLFCIGNTTRLLILSFVDMSQLSQHLRHTCRFQHRSDHACRLAPLPIHKYTRMTDNVPFHSMTCTIPPNYVMFQLWKLGSLLVYVRATVVRRLVSVVREVGYFYSTAVPPIKSKLL